MSHSPRVLRIGTLPFPCHPAVAFPAGFIQPSPFHSICLFRESITRSWVCGIRVAVRQLSIVRRRSAVLGKHARNRIRVRAARCEKSSWRPPWRPARTALRPSDTGPERPPDIAGTAAPRDLYLAWTGFQRRAVSMQEILGFDLHHLPPPHESRNGSNRWAISPRPAILSAWSSAVPTTRSGFRPRRPSSSICCSPCAPDGHSG